MISVSIQPNQRLEANIQAFLHLKHCSGDHWSDGGLSERNADQEQHEEHDFAPRNQESDHECIVTSLISLIPVSVLQMEVQKRSTP